MIPSTTKPLAKAIRTLEGWVLAVAAAVPWVVALVNPSTLPPKIAAEWSGIAAVALGISRSLVKGVALLKGGTGVAPEPVDIEALAAKVAASIGVQLPTADVLRQIIDAAIKAAQDPASLIGLPLPSDAVEAAAQPPAEAAPAEPAAPAAPAA